MKERLPPGQQLAAAGKWPLVGERLPGPGSAPWTVEIAGCVAEPRSWSLDELLSLPQVERFVDLHCVTRWSQFDVRFGGVLLAELLARSRPLAEARFVSFIARSSRDHATSLPLADALALETLVALTWDGRPLPPEHGGPVRTVVPRRYFYKSLKWLRRIELLSEDRLGYWEAVAGYHNEADPWQEQRFIASRLTKQETARLLASRDFSGRELLGIEAAGRDLSGLNARGALLRNANFRDCLLRGACFEQANLSNAHFDRADLTGASFRHADVEGADFTAADLRGADFRGASLFGVSFVTCDAAAVIDATTRFDPEAANVLTPMQAELLASKNVLPSPRFGERGQG